MKNDLTYATLYELWVKILNPAYDKSGSILAHFLIKRQICKHYFRECKLCCVWWIVDD